jgi:transcriptional regulator with XRE-family HTH domain
MVTSLDARLAQRVSQERAARGWTVAELAARSGVSRAMIVKIERHGAQPTAALIGRLSGAFGLPLSRFFAALEDTPSRLSRAAAQAVWTDPETHYVRRALSPAGDAHLQLTVVDLPASARVSFPAEAYAFIRQQIWVLRGRLTFVEGKARHDLRAGDCLQVGPPSRCTFLNTSARPCRYLVAVARR